MKRKDINILSKLRSANLFRNFVLPLAFASGIMLAGGIACVIVSLRLPAFNAMSVCIWIFPLSICLSLSVFFAICILRRESMNSTAIRTDFGRLAKNRLEAAYQLSKTDHPLKDAQKNEASDFYMKWVPPMWILWLFLLFSVYILSIIVQMAIIAGRESEVLAAIAKENKSIRKKHAAEQKEKEEYAEMVFTEPDSEIRAKPLDEIIWKAKAFSSSGLYDIKLEVSVNGELKKSIPVSEELFGKSGYIEIEGSFLLEDFDVVPFDLVSYNLMATAARKSATSTDISTQPQFVEVRPYREDAWLTQCSVNSLDLLLRLLRLQIALNKATHTIRFSGLALNNPVLIQQTEILSKDQKSLADDVKTYLSDPGNESEMSTNMFDNLSKAEKDMTDAYTCLKEGKNEK